MQKPQVLKDFKKETEKKFMNKNIFRKEEKNELFKNRKKNIDRIQCNFKKWKKA